MSDSTFLCKCGIKMGEEEFKHHFQKCTEFKKTFSKLDKNLGALLQQYTSENDNLKIIKFLLKSYISLIDRKIASL